MGWSFLIFFDSEEIGIMLLDGVILLDGLFEHIMDSSNLKEFLFTSFLLLLIGTIELFKPGTWLLPFVISRPKKETFSPIIVVFFGLLRIF